MPLSALTRLLRSRHERRRFWLGLQTLFAGGGGFFIPYRYAADVVVAAPYGIAESLYAAAEPDFRVALALLDDCHEGLRQITAEAMPPAPRWRQDWFAPLDAAMLYAFVRTRRPALLIEIGCGHSTRFAAKAIRDGGLATRHVAIDPAPRADIAMLGIELQTCVLAQADLAVFDSLRAGDILFIDSSHILMPGTDVDQLFNRILPGLATGVIVHVHDIFLPDDYPADWHWRGYNEQSALLPFLTGGAFQPFFASHYVATRMATALAETWLSTMPPDVSAAPATSLWLQKR